MKILAVANQKGGTSYAKQYIMQSPSKESRR
jgi:hypothetical protein